MPPRRRTDGMKSSEYHSPLDLAVGGITGRGSDPAQQEVGSWPGCRLTTVQIYHSTMIDRIEIYKLLHFTYHDAYPTVDSARRVQRL